MAISQEIRNVLLFYFKKGVKPDETFKKICAVYGQNALSKPAVTHWFHRFRSGDFSVEDQHRSRRPATEKVDEIFKLMHEDRHITTYQIAKELNMSQKTVWRHLHKAGYTKKLDVWVPHKLSAKNMADRVTACEMLKNGMKTIHFLRELSLVMKSGSGTRILSEKNHGEKNMSGHKISRKLD